MPAEGEISAAHWAGFIGVVLLFLALDLGVFHRRARVVRFAEALGWTAVWFTFSLLFSGLLWQWQGRDDAIEFLTGYIIELSLSMDNVFVIAVIFTYFRVPLEYQHRVLFWGILGALIMRGVMIGLGAALIRRFDWLLYVLGAFLILTGIKMIFAGVHAPHPERNTLIRVARRLFPVTPDFVGQRFVTRTSSAFLPAVAWPAAIRLRCTVSKTTAHVYMPISTALFWSCSPTWIWRPCDSWVFR
jgi:tellurite resistance protein TerC